MTAAAKIGSEFLVNTETANGQQTPTITGLTNGGFVVTWSDASGTLGDSDNFSIKAQLFSATGVKVGTEFLVNTQTANGQLSPSITRLSGDGFVVTWSDDSRTGADSSGFSVKAQVFSANGTRVGSEFLVNTVTASVQYDPSITGLANGGFVVTWNDFSGTSGDIKAQVFSADGTLVGSEFLVNTNTTNDQEAARITSLADGGFVVTWQDRSGTLDDSSGRSIKAQIFSAAGARIGTEFLVNTETASDQRTPTITGLTNGGFVVTWRDSSGTLGDNDSFSVKAQVFSADGTRVGSEFLVNTQIASVQWTPTITGLANGGFVVTWSDASGTLGDSDNFSIKAQLFGADGTRVGSEFLVNTETTNSQEKPTITGLTNGGFVVSWQDSSGTLGDSSGPSIKAQIFNLASAPTITSNGGGATAAVSIAENATAVTTVTATDADAGTTLTYSITGGADAALFTINASTGALAFTSAPDFEAPTDAGGNNVYDVVVEASDGSLTDTQAIAVTVANVDETPVISSNGGGATAAVSIAENRNAVTTVKVSETDARYTIIGGADASLFTINATTGSLYFKSAPNFEAPKDAGRNNIYDVVVRVSAGSWTDTQSLAVTVTDFNEVPLMTSDTTATVAENAPVPTVIYTATAADVDTFDTKTYSLSGTDAALFSINSATGALTLKSSANYEAKSSYSIDVVVTDKGGLTATRTVTVSVTNVNEAPTFSASSQSVSTTAGETKTVTLAATDVDGDTLTYTAATPGKGTATISGSALTYTPTSSASGTDSFVVTASDGKGGTATQTVNATIAAASTPSFRLTAADGWTGSVGGNGLVFGTSGYQDITVVSGSVTFDASFNKGGDIIRFDNPASSYSVVRSGSSAQISAGSSLTAVIPMGILGIATSFADGVRKMVFAGENFSVGAQAFSSQAVSITAAPDGTTAPTGADNGAAARLSLSGNALTPSQTAHVTISGKVTVFGTASDDVAALDAGKPVNLTFDASFNKGGDIIILDKDAGSYSAIRSGSSILLTATNETLSIPVGTTGLTLRFTDGDRSMLFVGGAFKIGDQTIGTAATALTPSVTFSIDIGTSSTSETASGAGAKVVFTDDATKNSFVKITNFGSDDLIRVTGAASYNFAKGDLDGDGAADDLSISSRNPDTSIVNEIFVLNAVSPEALIFDRASALSAVGFNFITFG